MKDGSNHRAPKQPCPDIKGIKRGPCSVQISGSGGYRKSLKTVNTMERVLLPFRRVPLCGPSHERMRPRICEQRMQPRTVHIPEEHALSNEITFICSLALSQLCYVSSLSNSQTSQIHPYHLPCSLVPLGCVTSG